MIQPGHRFWAGARCNADRGAVAVLLQGFPELFRAFHQMGKEREAKFLQGPAILFASCWLCPLSGVFFPDVLPIRVTGGLLIFGGLGGISKPTIGLIMLAAMLFAIFVGLPDLVHADLPGVRLRHLGGQQFR